MSVQVNQITKIYGKQKALDAITFSVQAGEILGFLGPNGAGKSTTMKILTGFIPANEGTATVCGLDVQTQSLEVRRKIGYLPELNPLYTDMYIREYLSFAASLFGIRGKDAKTSIEKMMDQTGLNPERNKRIHQLSKGYKQRVGLAAALIHDPEVLILDEPTSGLDPNQVVEIRQLIKNLGKEKTVIFSTHIMQEVEALCDRVVIINQGKIVADDTLKSLQSRQEQLHAFEVEFKNAVEPIVLQQIENVVSCVLNDKTWRITATTDIRESLADFARTSNNIILSLNKTTRSVEEVFQQYTR